MMAETTASQRVAPRASAASRCESGTASSTSLATDMTNGMIMMARMMLAANIDGP